MPIINNRGGVRLFLSDAISYTIKNGGSRGKALFYCIFGKQLSIEKAKQFIKKNESYPLSGRIGKKLSEREATSTQAPPLMKNTKSTHNTNMPNTTYQPNRNDAGLFELIREKFDDASLISQLDGLTSHQVVEKLKTMQMDSQTLFMLSHNKNTTDFGRVVDYVRSNPREDQK